MVLAGPEGATDISRMARKPLLAYLLLRSLLFKIHTASASLRAFLAKNFVLVLVLGSLSIAKTRSLWLRRKPR
jgi:hypothetical protein